MIDIFIIGFPRTVTTLLYKQLYLYYRRLGYLGIFEPYNLDIWHALETRGYITHDTVGYVPCSNLAIPHCKILRKVSEYLLKNPRKAKTHVLESLKLLHEYTKPLLVKEVVTSMWLLDIANVVNARYVLLVRKPRSLLRAYMREWLYLLNPAQRVKRTIQVLVDKLRNLRNPSKLLSLPNYLRWTIDFTTGKHGAIRSWWGLKLLAKMSNIDPSDSITPQKLLLELYEHYLRQVKTLAERNNVLVLYVANRVTPEKLTQEVIRWLRK